MAKRWTRRRRLVVRTVAISGFLALIAGGVRFFPQMDRLEGSDLQMGIKLTGLPLQGSEIDLMEGEYLIEIFSPKCGHCKRAVPKMNALADAPGLPSLVALSPFAQSDPATVDFKMKLGPRYAIATISRVDFFRLTSGHSYPRLAYVRDGVVQGVWESDSMPTVEDLQGYVKERRQGG